MAGGWLDHKQLQIIRGFGATPTDNLTLESPPVVVNLMSGAITLETNGWSPNIPAVEGGGVWADSPIADGRTLLAAPNANVTEQMTLIITDASYLGAIKALSNLNKMVQDCRDFWQSQYQVDPVYLMWWAGCGIGPQYALISNIELKPEYQDSPNPTIRVSMTIEREPFWRGLPPGANPKLWTFYATGKQIGLGSIVLANAQILPSNDGLFNQTIANKFEWNLATGNALSQNYIDIPATSIPGDAPALVEIAADQGSSFISNLYIARYSRKMSGTGHDNVTHSYALNFNGADSSSGAGAKTAVAVGLGVHGNGSTVNYYNMLRTVTGVDANYVDFSVWTTFAASGLILDRHYLKGTFAVFARLWNSSAAAPVLTDMKVQLVISEVEPSGQYVSSVTLPEVNPPLLNGANIPGLTYMGSVSLPLSNRDVQSLAGYGAQQQEGTNNLKITLQQKVLVATANRAMTFIDLIFIPIDEGMAQIAPPAANSAGLGTGAALLLDNTGYISRGETFQKAIGVYLPLVPVLYTGGVSVESRGQDITLLPHTAQRLYFAFDVWNGAAPPLIANADPSLPLVVSVNIVPRWAGIRDV